jgi:hypothetical protein
MSNFYDALAPTAKARIDARLAANSRLADLQAKQETIAREALEAADELNDEAQAAINSIEYEIDILCSTELD